MQLFDFVQDVGRRLFDTDAEAAAKIKEHLDIQLSGITDLHVSFDDGVATLSGNCDSAATKDMAVLIAGDVRNVRHVDATELVAPPLKKEEAEAFYHVVEPGDTLGFIAKRYYGKANLYMAIFDANRGLLKDPDKIFPGQKILIPSVIER